MPVAHIISPIPYANERCVSVIRVKVPASTANLGPGFDFLGMALDLYDEVTLSMDEPEDESEPSGEDAQYLELVQLGINHFYKERGKPVPVLTLTCDRHIPVGRGLGSSAAAIVAGIAGADAISGSYLDPAVLVKQAAAVEGHPDNSTPCFYGGLQVCVQDEGELVNVGLPLPDGLEVALFVPDFALPTHETRRLLPESLSRADVVYQSSRAALLVASLATGKLENLRVATQDRLHQPARGQLFPQMTDLFDAALDAGALCAYLSGGGPTIAAWTLGSAEAVRAALAERVEQAGLHGQTFVCKPSLSGVTVTEED